MSEQILSAVHGVTTMLFGIYCSAFFLGIKPIRKNILTMFLLFSEEHLKAWLLRVAINRCRDLTRAAHQKDTELDENLPAPDAFPDGSVMDAVRALPENYRNAIYLHYYEGYTAAEIGRMLGAPANTVLSWLRRGRAQLQTMLKEEIEDEVV